VTREEEARIIERVLGGDIEAYELLVTENQRQVYNLALRTTGSIEDAEDVTQEVFLKAFRSLAGFRGDSRFSVWLYRLTYNQSIDQVRRNKRHNAAPLTMASPDGEESELEIPDERFSPQDEAERRELAAAIREKMDRLSPEYRRILLLREIEGLSYGEIGQVLDLEEGTVKSRIFRARKKLCAMLTEGGNFDGFAPSKGEKGGVKDAWMQ